MRDYLKISLTTWFLLLILFMGAISLVIYRSVVNLVEQAEWVAHTHEVLEYVNQTLSNLKDIQSAQRGYIITGNQIYLEPYDASMPALEESMAKLKILVADSPMQVARVDALTVEARKRVKIAQDIIGTYDKQGMDAAVKLIKSGLGKREMDEARHIAATIEKEEQILLAERRQNTRQATNTTVILCTMALSLCFGVLIFLFYLTRKEVAQRRLVQTELENLNQHIMLVNKLGELLQSCQNLAEASSILREYLGRLLPDMQGYIALINNSRNTLETLVAWGDDDGSAQEDFAPDECWSLRSGRPHLVDAQHLNPVCSHIKSRPPSSLCLPMMAHGETIGLFFIAAARANVFDDMAQRKIRTTTEQTALALSNLKLQEVLRIQSIKDPLTLLYNRRYMEVTLERELARSKRHNQSVGIIMIDLDHFKRVNDTHGHEAGDMVLKELAGLIKNSVRAEDIACRYGGEEFIIILPNAAIAATQEKAEKLREAITQLSIHYRHELLGPFTLSAGVAVFPAHGDRADNLIAAADAALYKAKETRDSVVVAGVA